MTPQEAEEILENYNIWLNDSESLHPMPDLKELKKAKEILKH